MERDELDEVLDNEHARLHGDVIPHRDGSVSRRRRVVAARAIRDRERKLLTAYRAAIKAADEMREDFQRVWSDYSAGKHDGIEAYLRARAEIGE